MLSSAWHLYRIASVFLRHNLDEFALTLHLARPMALLFKLVPRRWRSHHDEPRGVRFRLALQELGPVFVKFGQLLSTRPDVVPEDIHHELVKLQDDVPPFPGTEAHKIIEMAYGDALENHFSHFETEPIASASVAQVHDAYLCNGTQVVVKVIRPGIDLIIQRDLSLLKTLADLAEKYWSEAPRFKPRELVDDYERNIRDELNLMREAANASQLRINFQDSDLIYVPKVYFDHCRHNVMVMEKIHGIPIRDLEAIQAAGIDRRQLAHNGVEIFFTQAFRDGFFHADMHPGNIFVSQTGQYRAVDFGIMGTLNEIDKRYLAENLLGFFNRDYHAVADAHVRAGWVPPDTRVEEFEGSIRTVCEPIFAKPISEISFGRLLVDLLRIARRYQMPVQPQLVLLQKTLLNIEGLGRQLYAELDLWETAKPFLERWMSEQIGPRAAVRSLRRELPNFATLAPELPTLAHQLMNRLRKDELVIRTRDTEIAALRHQVEATSRRTHRLLMGLALVVLAVVLAPGEMPIDAHPVSWLLVGSGLAFVVMGWFGKR